MSDAVAMVAALGGEVVTYLPYGGVAKQFKAIVERRPSQIGGGPAGPMPVNSMQVSFPMDVTDGVMTVQPRKDVVKFRKNLGDQQDTEFVVQKIMQEDTGLGVSGGMFTVMVQA